MAKHTTKLLICMMIIMLSCEQDDYILNSEGGPQVEDVIWIESISSVRIEADSLSSIELIVGINAEADTAYNQIELQTDKGFLSNGQQAISTEVNAYKKAIFSLYSGIEDGPVHVKAMVNNISIDTTITFVKAMPDMLQISPAILSTNSQEAKLYMSLLRNKGRVGKDIKVNLDYAALDTNGVQLDIQPFIIIQNISDSIRVGNPLNLSGRFELTANVGDTKGEQITAKAMVIFE